MISAFRRRPDLWRFIKFLFVGVVNTVFGFAAYAFFLKIVGFNPHLALACAYVMGVIWNYFTHARIVFGAEGFRRMPLYVLAYSALYGVNSFLLDHLIDDAGVPPLGAQAILVLPMAMLAFTLVSIVLTGRIPFVRGKP